MSAAVHAASIVHVDVNKEMKWVLPMSSAEDLQQCDTQGKKWGLYDLFMIYDLSIWFIYLWFILQVL